MLIDFLLEEVKESRISLHIPLPLRALEIFAQLQQVVIEIIAEILRNFVLNPHRDVIHFSIHVDGQPNFAPPVADWLVSQQEVFVFQLDVLWIDIALVAQLLL